MIADMAVHGFSPMDVREWTLGQWSDVGQAFERAYAPETESQIPPPTAEEFKKFKAKGARA